MTYPKVSTASPDEGGRPAPVPSSPRFPEIEERVLAYWAADKTFPASVEGLQKRGHKVVNHRQGDAHSIWVEPSTRAYIGAADRRLSGKVAGY